MLLSMFSHQQLSRPAVSAFRQHLYSRQLLSQKLQLQGRMTTVCQSLSNRESSPLGLMNTALDRVDRIRILKQNGGDDRESPSKFNSVDPIIQDVLGSIRERISAQEYGHNRETSEEISLSEELVDFCDIDSKSVSAVPPIEEQESTLINDTQKQLVGSLLASIVSHAKNSIMQTSAEDTKFTQQMPQLVGTVTPPPPEVTSFTVNDVTRGYTTNPTISTIALAHVLWSHVLRPGVDTAIDATAGNGGDSVALAKLLFPDAIVATAHNQFNNNGNHTEMEEGKASYSQLVAIDIHPVACQNTSQKLAALLPANIVRDNVAVLHTSHAPLPLPRNASAPIALVVYNLGFLPQSNEKSDDCITVSATTIASMADAAVALRIGGILSAMTYPRTNREEARAVHAFLEGLAIFSSNAISCSDYLNSLAKEPWCNERLHARLSVALESVLTSGGRGQKWRVHEHRKLGWIDAPILLTATRIS